MKINENTKLMGRLHKKPNARGLNIYNPYFEETDENAIYLLFVNEDPKVLLDGVRNLNMAGGIAAGFESDPRLFELMDEVGPVAKSVGRVGTVVNRNGKLYGENQGGYGLLQSIRSKIDITGKKLVVLGAGHVVTAILTQIELDQEKPSEIHLFNRTVDKAEKLAERFNKVTKTGPLEELEKASGDIFINATDIGAPYNEGDDYQFTEDFISKFGFVADTTFQPLKPQLIAVADNLGKPNSPGYRMFTYQGKMCLELILGIKVDPEKLEKYVISGLGEQS